MTTLFLQSEMTGYLNTLANYGVLGVFAMLMIGVIYFMSKQFIALHKRNEVRIQDLEKRHDQYMTEDRVRLIDTVNSNNNVIENNTAMMQKLLSLVEKLEKN
jgi:hypothetical protein